MKIKALIAVMVIISIVALPAYAGPKGKPAAAAQQPTAGERIANETADAVADVLTGKDTAAQKPSGSMPPGLAKKGKTPSGWTKGEKTGWDKKAEPKKESPIKTFVKGLFGQK